MFLGASFPAGGIPYAYSLILQQFLESVIKQNSQERIGIFEYLRPKWTFHAKGLWFYAPGATLPCATMVCSDLRFLKYSELSEFLDAPDF